MDLSLVSGVSHQQAGTSQQNSNVAHARGDEAAVARTSKVDEEKVKVPAVDKKEELRTPEERYQRVEKAAQQVVRDIYVVSDTKFTIFKDNSGQYITRFTSLRDGSVTYIPEPDILQHMQSRKMQREAMMGIEA